MEERRVLGEKGISPSFPTKILGFPVLSALFIIKKSFNRVERGNVERGNAASARKVMKNEWERVA